MHISLNKTIHLLETGHVVAVPTETVYGLAASLTQPTAILNIFSLKGRPSNNPLIIHVGSVEQIFYFTKQFPENFHQLAETFWPGPLTVVLKVETNLIPTSIRAGLPTAAFRIPNHPLTRELLQRVGPLVMPSANISGRPSATNPSHVESDFGKDFPVLDGGACQCGVESTILHQDGDRWEIIRQGALSADLFAPILGYIPEIHTIKPGAAPTCPGQMYRHYAPRAQLHLSNSLHQCREVVVGFSDRVYPLASRLFCLGPSTDAHAVAENLYFILRQLDEEQVEKAWVDMHFPQVGLWLTLAERLKKAANK